MCMSGVKLSQHFVRKNIIPIVQKGGGSVRVWGCLAVLRPGPLAIIDSTMNYALNWKILNIQPSICDLKLKRTWVLQQVNNPKHTSKSTSGGVEKLNKGFVVPSQN